MESLFVLYRNGSEVLRSKPEAVDISGGKNFAVIPIKKKLQLKNVMQPGDYVLQAQVRNKKAKGKQSLAEQTLDFEIAE